MAVSADRMLSEAPTLVVDLFLISLYSNVSLCYVYGSRTPVLAPVLVGIRLDSERRNTRLLITFRT